MTNLNQEKTMKVRLLLTLALLAGIALTPSVPLAQESDHISGPDKANDPPERGS